MRAGLREMAGKTLETARVGTSWSSALKGHQQQEEEEQGEVII